MIISQDGVWELANRIELGPGLILTQELVDDDYVAKIDISGEFGISEEFADTRYVIKSGDVMTGNLGFNSGNIGLNRGFAIAFDGYALGSANDYIYSPSDNRIDTVVNGNARWQVSDTSLFGGVRLTVKSTLTNPGWSALIGGDTIQLVLAENATDATLKSNRFGGAHYTNAEEPAAMLVVSSDAANNSLSIGGGTSAFNAATVIGFYTAANNTTVTGTQRASFDSTGLFQTLYGQKVVGTFTPGAGVGQSALFVGSVVTASSGFVRGILAQPTLVAAANADTLDGMRIGPSFTPGTFTGLIARGLVIGNFSVAGFTSPGTPRGLEIGQITATGATSAASILLGAGPTGATNNYYISANTFTISVAGVFSGLSLVVSSGAITGGASNMVVVAGTGASRTFTVQTTTSGGVATDALLLDTAQRMRVKSTLNNPSWSTLIGGDTVQLVLAENATDATQKTARLGGAHYTNAEEPVAMLSTTAGSAANTVNIGGGTSVFNAATQIQFYTAADNTTTTGTARATINTAGLFSQLFGVQIAGTFTPSNNDNAALLMTSVITAASAIAHGAYFRPNLTAAANADTLEGMRVTPAFTPGSFTGLIGRGIAIGSFSVAGFTSPGDPRGLEIGQITGTGAAVASSILLGAGPTGATTNYLINANNFKLTSAGAMTLSAALTYGGVTLNNAVTGTGNMVLSAGPTFTGTVTTAALSSTSITGTSATINGTSNAILSLNATTGNGARVLFRVNSTDFASWYVDTANKIYLMNGAGTPVTTFDNGALILSGSLTGVTSATFNDSVTVNGVTNAILTLNAATGNAARVLFAVNNVNFASWFSNAANKIQMLDSGGGAVTTFDNGALTTTSVTIPNGQYFRATRNTGSVVINVLGFDSGSDGVTLRHGGGGFTIRDESAALDRWTVAASTGHFVPAADNTYDIGTSSVRIRNLYAANQIQSATGFQARKNGSDTFEAGPFFEMANAAGTRAWTWQLASSSTDYLNLWFYNGSAAILATWQTDGTLISYDFALSSDERLKLNRFVITGALDKIDSLSGYTFEMVNDAQRKRKAGLLAQEVQKVLPEAVGQDKDGFLTLSYDSVIPLLVEGIKDLRRQVKALQS